MNTDSELVTFRKEGVDWNKNLSLVSRSFLGHLPQGRCGLKCDSIVLSHPGIMSPSARKVWIEMHCNCKEKRCVTRHLPQGRCGLKLCICIHTHRLHGHLPQGRCGLKVLFVCFLFLVLQVTFRKEGVDWNFYSSVEYTIRQTSPSAKKVWIEIRYSSPHRHPASVTFCKEGVDWNTANV